MNYVYPDLTKGKQISQYEEPICEKGWVEVGVNGAAKRIHIRRAHLEEDAGKNLHDGGAGGSRVDLNRAGTPLLEIVTEPDMRSADEVVAYLKQLRDMLMYLEVCDGNMEQASLRCEPNLSLRPVGQKALGTKVELKNINSFKFVKDALEYEIKRQARGVNEGGKMRGELNRSGTAVDRSPVSPERLVSLLKLADNGTISLKVAREIFPDLYASGKTPEQIVKEKGLTQVSDEGALEKIIDDVMAKNSAQLAQYRGGKEAVFGFFVGQVMKESGGKANPGKVNELLKRKLAG